MTSTQRVRRWLIAGALAPVLIAFATQSIAFHVTEMERSQKATQHELNALASTLWHTDDAAVLPVLLALHKSGTVSYAAELDASGAIVHEVGDPNLPRAQVVRSAMSPTSSLVLMAAPRPSESHPGITALLSVLAMGIAIVVVVQLVRRMRKKNEAMDEEAEMLRQTGMLARVGGWEMNLPSGEWTLSDESKAVIGDLGMGADLMKLIALEVNTLVQSVDSGEALETEVRVHHRSGGARWFRVRGQATRSSETTIRAFGALQDVTEQHEAREKVLDASRAKSNFLANTSHEMRTPLNGILGMAQLALETEVNSEQRSYLEAITHSGRTMLATVNDLLDISRIESGKTELEAAPLHLEDLLVEAMRSLAPAAHAKNIGLVLSFSAGLEPRRIGDALRISQILNNLVGNALKFTTQGEVEVTVSAGEYDDVISLRVRDTGEGIAADRLDAIFDAFTQADGSITRRHGGSGLGLTITRQLCRQMKGDITVSSTPGIGSTFKVTMQLPKEKVLRVVEPPPVPQVLILHPSLVAARALRLTCERLGIEATVATSLDSAIAHSKRVSCALVDSSIAEGANRLLCPRVLFLAPFGATGALRRGRTCLATPISSRELWDALSDPLQGIPSGSPSGVHRPNQPLRVTPLPQMVGDWKPHVLIAEDNAVNAMLARRLVEKAGCRVTHVVDGQAALDALSRHLFDLVLMDCQMPVLDGLEATRLHRLREQGGPEHVRIVALTANAAEADEKRCREAGMDAFIPKPIVFERLRHELKQLVIPSDETIRQRARARTSR